jgi:hypothetical protein
MLLRKTAVGKTAPGALTGLAARSGQRGPPPTYWPHQGRTPRQPAPPRLRPRSARRQAVSARRTTPFCALSPRPVLQPGPAVRFASSAPSVCAIVQNSLVSRRRSGDSDPRIQLEDGLDLLAALITVGLLVLTLAGRSGIPRTLLTIGFACYVPGRAIVSNWPLMARWSQAAMSIIYSIAVLGLVASVTLWAHFWHPVGVFQVVAVLSLVALCFGAARRHGGKAWLAAHVRGPASGVSQVSRPSSPAGR